MSLNHFHTFCTFFPSAESSGRLAKAAAKMKLLKSWFQHCTFATGVKQFRFQVGQTASDRRQAGGVRSAVPTGEWLEEISSGAS